jgi:predicted PurR-regulated permease PerM
VATTTEPDRKPTLRIEISPTTLFVVLAVIATVWVVFRLTTVFIVVTVALVLVGTLDPIITWLEKRGVKRGRGLALTFFVVAAGLIGVLLLTVPPLVAQLANMIAGAPASRDRLVADLSAYDWARPVAQALQSLPLDHLVTRAGPEVLDYSSKLLKIIGFGLSALFLAIYLLADPTSSRGMLFALVPRQYHVKLARILSQLKLIVGGYMRGQLITSAAIALFVFIYMTIYGVKDALAIALFAGLTDIIPFIGGYLASAPVIIAVSSHGVSAMIIAAIAMIVYQELESRVLVPRVYGKVLRLHPAVVVVALLVGGTLMGILGALLALPIAAGTQMIMRELRVSLPGDSTAHEADLEQDRKVEALYEQLAEGAPAADAAQIADQLAQADKPQPPPDANAPAPTPTNVAPSAG